MLGSKNISVTLIILVSLLELGCSDAQAPLIDEAPTALCAQRRIEGEYIIKYTNRGFHRRKLSPESLDSARHDPAVEWVEPNYRLPTETGVSRNWTYVINPGYLRLIGAEQAQLKGIRGSGLTVGSVDWRHPRESVATIQEIAPEIKFATTDLQMPTQNEFHALVAIRESIRRGARIIDVGAMSGCSKAMRRSLESWQNLDVIFVHNGQGEGLTQEHLENFIDAGPYNLSTALLTGALALAWSSHPEMKSRAIISAYSNSERCDERSRTLQLNVPSLLYEVQKASLQPQEMTMRSSFANMR